MVTINKYEDEDKNGELVVRLPLSSSLNIQEFPTRWRFYQSINLVSKK